MLGVSADNLGNRLRRLVRPVAIQAWSLPSLQKRVFKTDGRLIWPARDFILQLTERYLTGRLFRQILGRIERLGWHPTRSSRPTPGARAMGEWNPRSGGISAMRRRRDQPHAHGPRMAPASRA